MRNFKIKEVNEWLTSAQSIAVIIGLFFAVFQLNQLVAQTRDQDVTLQLTQKQNSATLGLQLEDRLNGSSYSAITSAIQNHDENYPILATQNGGRSGTFRNLAIENYISNFEDIGALVRG